MRSTSERTHPVINATGLQIGRRLLFHFLIPMEPQSELDPVRVAEYRWAAEAGDQPAALGVSVLDIRAPALWSGDEIAEQRCLATYVLDGHDKIQAAAVSGRTVRLLTLISREHSMALSRDVAAAVAALAGPGA